MIPEDIINEIKYRNDIETAISQYVNLKRRGKNLIASAAAWAAMSSPLRGLLKTLIT